MKKNLENELIKRIDRCKFEIRKAIASSEIIYDSIHVYELYSTSYPKFIYKLDVVKNSLPEIYKKFTKIEEEIWISTNI